MVEVKIRFFVSMKHEMHLTIAYSTTKKKRNLVLINNDTYQRETLSERPIRQPLKRFDAYPYWTL